MVGNPSGLTYHRLPATPGDFVRPFQGQPTSPVWTHSASEQAPFGTTTKPGAVIRQFAEPKYRKYEKYI